MVFINRRIFAILKTEPHPLLGNDWSQPVDFHARIYRLPYSTRGLVDHPRLHSSSYLFLSLAFSPIRNYLLLDLSTELALPRCDNEREGTRSHLIAHRVTARWRLVAMPYALRHPPMCLPWDPTSTTSRDSPCGGTQTPSIHGFDA